MATAKKRPIAKNPGITPDEVDQITADIGKIKDIALLKDLGELIALRIRTLTPKKVRG